MLRQRGMHKTFQSDLIFAEMNDELFKKIRGCWDAPNFQMKTASGGRRLV